MINEFMFPSGYSAIVRQCSAVVKQCCYICLQMLHVNILPIFKRGTLKSLDLLSFKSIKVCKTCYFMKSTLSDIYKGLLLSFGCHLCGLSFIIILFSTNIYRSWYLIWLHWVYLIWGSLSFLNVHGYLLWEQENVSHYFFFSLSFFLLAF